jgi:tRNA(Ile)-lysidine synthase
VCLGVVVCCVVARRRATIITRVKQTLPAGSKVLVAVSGGRDSVVLLHALCRVRRLLGLHLEVGHVDHRLRSDSHADAAFVRTLCEELGVVCHVAVLGKKPSRYNMEAWARTERYRALQQMMTDRGLGVLVTAHNANDVAETLLIRLVANKELNSIDAHDERRACVRPLLGISREQIDEYVRAEGISFVEDPSNSNTDLVRNRVRHTLLPLIVEHFDPSAVWSLADRAASLDRDCEALQQLAADEVKKVGPLALNSPRWLTRAQATLQELPYALAWRVAERLLEPLIGYLLGERRSAALLGVLVGEVGSMQLERGVILERGAGGLRWAGDAPLKRPGE